MDMASTTSLLEATLIRRSTLDLKNASTIPDSRIIDLVKHSLLHTPTSFHVQSARAVVLLNRDHGKLWDMAYTASEKTTPEELFKTRFAPNINAFRGAYGTVRKRCMSERGMLIRGYAGRVLRRRRCR